MLANKHIARPFVFSLGLVLAAPALAAGWNSYANSRYGATADVPPGFEQMGPEAANSDGLIFRSHSGGVLTIYGAEVPGRRFEAYVESQMSHEADYNGWNIGASTVTPGWAEYSGVLGGRHLQVRVLSSCNGRQAVTAKFEFNGAPGAEVDRVLRSLRAGSARSC